ncbi:uncharacterized protein Triagg1_6009 [Trichoderma aggressivum f. europaeum]|uniref:AB hydrolase-1 domain-containing protein n=1 Tax=Trichoderma aggressivum f. europaeum TaxID=173218 RepID=A0AAE1M003_9HYPO|nr:hypothetical protein Triagg1_6009 [Trichoderma aggressivum f. europaeum]
MLNVGKYVLAGLALGGAHARSTDIASVANERMHGHESFVDNDGHGFPDRETTWNTFQIQEFAKKYTLVTPTLRGHPPSHVPLEKEDYAAAAYVSDMLAVIKAVGKGSAVIVGHDVGGLVVQKFASAHSDMLKGLVMAIRNVSAIVQHILNETYRDRIADYLHKSPLYGMLDFYNENFPAPPYRQNLSTEGLTQSAIIWGELDPYFSPAMLNGLEAWFDYGIRLVVTPGAGHWSFRDKPTRLNAELKSFLDFLEY